MVSGHQTAVVRHNIKTEGHRFDFIDVKNFDTERLESSRKLIEGVHTKITTNAINRVVIIPGAVCIPLISKELFC